MLESIVKSESSLTMPKRDPIAKKLESIVKSESSLTAVFPITLSSLLESIVKSESSLTVRLQPFRYCRLRVLLNQNHL